MTIHPVIAFIVLTLGGFFCLACFLAFHKMRMERDYAIHRASVDSVNPADTPGILGESVHGAL